MLAHDSLVMMAAVVAAVVMLGCASGPEPAGPARADGDGDRPMAPAQPFASGVPEPAWSGLVEPVAWTVRAPGDPRPLNGEHARLTVRGMSCPKCANNIDRQLRRVPGVAAVDIDMSTGFVLVEFAAGPERPSAQTLSRAIHNTGFTLVEVAEC